jgi:mono/diheme cytochrome c family protein
MENAMKLTRFTMFPRAGDAPLAVLFASLATASCTAQEPPPAATAPQGTPANTVAAAPAPAAEQAADLGHGEEIYVSTCLPCHGDAGQGGPGGGAPLMTDLKVEDIARIATNGQNSMPAFGTAYKPSEINDVAHYIVEKLLK